MEPLVDGQPGPHESWRELADHSLTHDQLACDTLMVDAATTAVAQAASN